MGARRDEAKPENGERMVIELIIGVALAIITLVILSRSLRINSEWNQAMVFRLGKYNRTVGPGMYFTYPFVENAIVRDMRTTPMDIREQATITKDNVPVRVDAVAFIRIIDINKSVLNIRDLHQALNSFSQVTLRNIVGEMDLDDVLSRREVIATRMREAVDEVAEKWGVDIERVELQNIGIPESMQRAMAQQAEAEREARGVLIKSQAEEKASENYQKASAHLEKSKYGFALRQLQTISDISHDQSNTIILFPTEGFNPSLLGTLGAKVPEPRR
ncbi:MAG: SPFH domain-containing protein [Candidatus Bathyarchaeota archaeon]|nr:MAG: SPFH domain-containing protein [Candidatus Bathyarchaeota archaeon]